MIARLEGIKDISCISSKLEALEYDVVQQNEKIVFIYRNKASSSDLGRDVKSAKDACKFSGSIKCTYGTNSAIY